MRSILPIAARVGFLGVVIASVGAQCLSAVDGDFTAWSWSTSGPAGASYVMSGSGNPGACFEARNYVPSISGGHIRQLFVKNDLVWDPSTQGAIDTISMRIDTASVQAWGEGHGVGLLVEQNGVIFIACCSSCYTVTGTSSAWHTLSISGCTSSVLAPPSNPQLHPDFSAAGAPIRFGFAVINSTPTFTPIVQRYDNWRLNVYIAAPATVTVLGGSCGPGASAPRLNSQRPVLGTTPVLQIDNATPRSTGFLVVGYPRGVPWPIGPGCVILVNEQDASTVAVFQADAAGSYSLPFALPLSCVLANWQVNWQSVQLTSGWSFGLEFTNALSWTLGF